MKDVRTGLMFSPVPTEYLSFDWDSVSKVLKKSVATAEGKYEVDDLFNCIMEDEIVLWIVVDHDKDDEIIVQGICKRCDNGVDYTYEDTTDTANAVCPHCGK